MDCNFLRQFQKNQLNWWKNNRIWIIHKQKQTFNNRVAQHWTHGASYFGFLFCKYTCLHWIVVNINSPTESIARKTSKWSFVSGLFFHIGIQCDICFTTFREMCQKESMRMTLKIVHWKMRTSNSNSHYLLFECFLFFSFEIGRFLCTEKNIIPGSRLEHLETKS